MASPVDTTVVYTHSQMSGAPVLLCQPGSLIAMLDATLVNGFDTKTATSITIVSGIATLTFSGLHSAEQESVIQISGATAPFTDINGRQKVVAKTSTTVTFRTALPDGVVTGTLTFMMASAGWAKAFSATNVAAYRSINPMSSGHYLRIDDNDPLTARVRGYELMTDINTGVNPFPADSQLLIPPNLSTPTAGGAIGGYWYKGLDTAGTIPVGWTTCADTRFFMYCSQNYQSQALSYSNYTQGHFRGFGEPIAFRPSGDTYSTVISIGYQNSSSQGFGGSFSQGDSNYGMVYIARPYQGIGLPQQMAVCSYSQPQIPYETISGSSTGMLGKFPSVIDGSLRFSQKFIKALNPPLESDNVPRADIPGILFIPMSSVYRALPPKTIILGTGALAGRKLVAVGTGNYSTDPTSNPDASGISLIDITGPWR